MRFYMRIMTKFMKGNDGMREEKILKFLRKAIKQEHLYTTEELVYMKQELRNLEENFKKLKKAISKGFGN